MNNLFVKTVRASMTFEEAANILQEANLGPSALEAARFLCQAQWRPGAVVNPLKHPFKAASLFVKSDKNDKREYLSHIHSDGEFLEASDGNTLIRLPSSVSPGWYGKKGESVPEPSNSHWPNFERVIPHNPGCPVYLSDFRTESLANPHGGGYTLCAVLPEVSPGVDAVFDERLCDRMRRVGVWQAELFMDKDRARMLVAKEGKMVVIIMGMKL